MQTIAQILAQTDLVQFDISEDFGSAEEAQIHINRDATIVDLFQVTMTRSGSRAFATIRVAHHQNDNDVSCYAAQISDHAGDCLAILCFGDESEARSAVAQILTA